MSIGFRLRATAAVALFASVPSYGQIILSPVVTGLSGPVAITHAGDGSNRLFITLQEGRVMIYSGTGLLATPFLDIRGLVLAGGERGLLSVAFHPLYPDVPYFFVNYTRQTDGATVIARYTISGNPNVANPASAVTLLVIAQPFANHNGGQLQFGPDGFLYIGMGDGGSGNDPDCYAQRNDSLLGKMLRIDVNQNVNTAPYYGIPSTNPFVGSGDPPDEVWAKGLRNPWRFSFDRVTGDLMIGDVGQSAREEVNWHPAGGPVGENYGWKVMEGTQCTTSSTSTCPGGVLPCNNAGYTLPVLEYSHAGGRCSITGGYIYRGSRSPGLYGKYLYADFCTGEIFAATLTAGAWTTQLILDAPINITTFGEDEVGELFLAGGGVVYRIVGDETMTVSLTPATRTVGEGSGSAVVSLRVTTSSGNPTAAAGSVTFATADGSATSGSDFTSTSGTFNIPVGTPSGASLTVAPVPILDDRDNEGNQSFSIALGNFTNVLAGANTVQTITIVDNEPGTEISEVYRLRHPSIGAYLFTIYPTERDAAGAQFGYLYEGLCCGWFNTPAGDGRTELFRLFSATAGEYLFTIYASERDNAVAQFGYLYEGVAAYCNPAPTPAATRPWFRLRHGNKHFYTVYPEERDAAVSQYGYVYEGVSCYLPPP
jgi:glucose/arabinose dehydrogenase